MWETLTETIYAAVNVPQLWNDAADKFAKCVTSPTVVTATERPGSAGDSDLEVMVARGPATDILGDLMRRTPVETSVSAAAPDLVLSEPSLMQGDGASVGEWLHIAGSLGADGPLCHVGVARTPGPNGFTPIEMDRFLTISRHVIRASCLAIQRPIASVDRHWDDAIDAITIGVFLLSEDGRLLRANSEGNRLLTEARHITVANGRLRALRADKAAEFQELLDGVAQGQIERGAMLASGDCSSGQDCLIILVPAHARGAQQEGTGPRSVIVYIGAVEKDLSSLEGLLRQAFRLTRMEARTTIALARGLGVDEVARSLGLAPATVRTHVKNVYSKTGVQRQSQLVLRMLGGGMPLLASATDNSQDDSEAA